MVNFWSSKAYWKKAIVSTFTCLIGCSIGDFLSMTFFQWYDLSGYVKTTMVISMGAALLSSFVFEVLILRLREKLSWGKTIFTASSMSVISMLLMAGVENLVDYYLTGFKVPLTDYYYWLAFLLAMGASFLVTLVYNYYKLRKYHQSCH